MSDISYDLLVDIISQVGAAEVPGLAQLDRTPTPWEKSMQATCDCLSWRGALDALERRQAEDALGETVYAESPVHARPTIVAAHLLMDKGVITPDELQAKMAEVRARLEQA